MDFCLIASLANNNHTNKVLFWENFNHDARLPPPPVAFDFVFLQRAAACQPSKHLPVDGMHSALVIYDVCKSRSGARCGRKLLTMWLIVWSRTGASLINFDWWLKHGFWFSPFKHWEPIQSSMLLLVFLVYQDNTEYQFLELLRTDLIGILPYFPVLCKPNGSFRANETWLFVAYFEV